MFVTSAMAQDTTTPAAPAMGASDLLIQFAPILLLVVIFWLLIFRPWETDSGGLLQSGLGDNGGVVGAWPGSTLIRYEGTADMSPSEGVTVGCTR